MLSFRIDDDVAQDVQSSSRWTKENKPSRGLLIGVPPRIGRTGPMQHGEELDLSARHDGVPSDCVVNFDNIHTLPRELFRRRVAALPPVRIADACRVLAAATGC